MNSKNFLSFILLLLLIGCGVKSDPIAPKGTMLPSYVDKFLDKDKENEKKE